MKLNTENIIVDIWEQVSRRTDNLNQKASHVHANSTSIWSSASCVLKALNISSQIIVPVKVMTYIQISLVYFTCDIEESTYLTAMEQQMELYISDAAITHRDMMVSKLAGAPTYATNNTAWRCEIQYPAYVLLLQDAWYMEIGRGGMCGRSKEYDIARLEERTEREEYISSRFIRLWLREKGPEESIWQLLEAD